MLKIVQDVDIKNCTRITIKKKHPQMNKNKTFQPGNEDVRKTGNTRQKIRKDKITDPFRT
jgi:hypothetical protein